MLAVILAGGLGTRLRPLTNSTPKAMAPIDGRPFLEHEISLLKKEGFGEFILCVGYLSNAIVDHFGDGSDYNVKIEYSLDGPHPLGPAGALKRAEHLIVNHNDPEFFVTYGDAYLILDYSKVLTSFRNSGKMGMMVVYENHNKFGRSDVAIKDGLVVKYNKKEQSEDMVYINFGVSVLRMEALTLIPEEQEVGEEEFYGELIKRGELASFVTNKRFYEIGTPERLKEFEEFLKKKGLP